jgi:hypothetical protein
MRLEIQIYGFPFYLVLGILAIISAIRGTVGTAGSLVMYLCLYFSVGKYFRSEFFILKQLDAFGGLPAIAIGC